MAPGVETRVACTIHHGGYLHEQKPELRQLALQGRVTLLVLSDHVGSQLKNNLLKWALFEKEVAWDRIDIETMVPVGINLSRFE
jgi:hypothetical protein